MTIYNQIHNRLSNIALRRQSFLKQKGIIAQINLEQEFKKYDNEGDEYRRLNHHLKNIPYNQLKSAYGELSSILTNIHRTKEAHVTLSEHAFLRRFSRYSRLNIYPSFWISNFNLDFFIPKYRLAIEVDGGIHNSQAKMRKDDYKDQYLEHLGILVFHVENYDAKKMALLLPSALRRSPSLDSRGVKRLMKRIYILSLTRHLTIDELSNLFSFTI